MKPGFYTWGEFKAEVLEFLPSDKDRLGAEGYVQRMIRQACLDLQTFIPLYRKGHENIFHPDDLVTEGSASRGVLPPQAELQDIYIVNTKSKTRWGVGEVAFSDRFELVYGRVDLKANNGVIAIDRQAYTFYVYPEIQGDLALSMNWDGVKVDFQDHEETPFDEQVIAAVAEFVKGKLAREVDNDMTAYASYFDPRVGSYVDARRKLYLTAQNRTRVRS